MTNETQKKDECEQLLNDLNSWPIMFFMGGMILVILIMQSAWTSIYGLYFENAYQAIAMPYMFYIIFSLYKYSQNEKINKTKLMLMFISFALMFLPNFYLVFTSQVDIHTSVFGKFNNELNHFPYAKYLPFLCFLAIFTPYGDFLNTKDKVVRD